jgi:hypothetical protein
MSSVKSGPGETALTAPSTSVELVELSLETLVRD